MKKLTFAPRAVIFDMDGVITDTMGYHYTAWKKALASYGIKVGYYDIYLREGQKGLETAWELMEKNGLKPSKAGTGEILKLKEKLFKEISRPKLISGSKSLIRDLKNAGFILALVTGTARSEIKHILPDKMLASFDFSVTGNEVKSGKPNPEPYLKALKNLNLKAKDCLVLENAPYGIKSAKSAGLYCAAITTYLPPEYLKEADIILNSLKEADQMLLRAAKNIKCRP